MELFFGRAGTIRKDPATGLCGKSPDHRSLAVLQAERAPMTWEDFVEQPRLDRVFIESAHWADSIIESQCPYVCM